MSYNKQTNVLTHELQETNRCINTWATRNRQVYYHVSYEKWTSVLTRELQEANKSINTGATRSKQVYWHVSYKKQTGVLTCKLQKANMCINTWATKTKQNKTSVITRERQDTSKYINPSAARNKLVYWFINLQLTLGTNRSNGRFSNSNSRFSNLAMLIQQIWKTKWVHTILMNACNKAHAQKCTLKWPDPLHFAPQSVETKAHDVTRSGKPTWAQVYGQ